MRAIGEIFTYRYILILLIITASDASNDDRNNQNDIKHVQHITGLVITRAVPYAIPHPYQVTVEQEVPYPVKVPVGVPVDRPFEVHIPKPFTVPIIRPVPYPVHRLVPYPVHVPVKHNEEHTTPVPHLHEYHHKPLDLSNQIEYEVAASLSRPVPVRAPLPPSTTPEPASNQFNYNALETMRLPLKPVGPMTAISYQAHRPYAGFNIGAHQFTEHPQYPSFPATEPNHQQQQQQQHQQQHHQPQPQQHQQQQPILIRRPIGFSPDPAMIGAYQHQPNPETDHLNGAEPSDISDEQNHDILANFAEGAVFNINNHLRRRSSSKETTSKSSTVKTTTTTTTSKPPKKT